MSTAQNEINLAFERLHVPDSYASEVTIILSDGNISRDDPERT